MNRTLIIYLVLLVLVIAGIIFIESGKPKPINWYPSYNVKDKIPFGLYVLDNEMENLFSDQEIEKLDETPYEYFSFNKNVNSEYYYVSGTFIYISRYCELDEKSVNELCSFVQSGNDAFISSAYFQNEILNELNIELEYGDFFEDSFEGTIALQIGDEKRTYELDHWHNTVYFSFYDSTGIEILGYKLGGNGIGKPNFIRVQYGDGTFILHSNPEVFANYFLLDSDKYRYTEKVANSIKGETVFFYTDYLSRQNLSDSPMRFILSQPGLKWAWYFILLGTLVFMIFRAKRKQRIIPINIPNKNLSLQFVRTVAGLYYRERDYHAINEKRVTYFLEKLRKNYRLDTTKIDENFAEKLQHVTGRNKHDVDDVVRLIHKHQVINDSTERNVIELNAAIEKLNL